MLHGWGRRKATETSGLRQRSTRFVAVLALVAVIATGGVITGSTTSAWATDWPTWQDVANARKSVAAAEAKVKEIEALIAGLVSEVDRTAAEAEEKGAIWAEADQKYQEAALEADALKQQADAAQATALESQRKAGQLAAQLARASNQDITATLLANADNADGLLYGLGMASKISAQAAGVYAEATQDANTAQALNDQAEVARTILEELKVAAEKAFAEAQVAADAAANALAVQQERQATLEAQLAVLRENRDATEADYLKGVQERIAAGASLGAGEISASGWARPAAGRITDPFGMRIHPVYGTWRLHTGTDIGASCNQAIYAASGGIVTYAGRYGTYGNWITIDHGNGIVTGYAHIVDGGLLVRQGQEVVVGQNIAKVGSTGASTGCHLHFEVRQNGRAIDPVPFMRGQGISLGTTG